MLWYYAEGGQQRGPVSQEELQRLVTAGTIAPSALVWKEGMGSWEPLGSVAIGAGIRLPDPSSVPPATAPAPGGQAGTAGANATASPVPDGMVRCAECGKSTLVGDTVEFENRHVCAQCKPRLLQRLSEGAPLPASEVGKVSEAQLVSEDYQLDYSLAFEQATSAMKFEPLILILGTIFSYGSLILLGLISVIPLIGVFIQMIGQVVLVGPIMAGLIRICLAASRKEPVDFSMLFWGFGPRFVQLVLVQGIPQLITLAVFFPMTLLGFSQAQRGFGMAGPTPGQLMDQIGVFGIVWMIVGFLVIAYLTLRWMYAAYLVVDKNYRALDALRLSYRMFGKHWFQNTLGFVIMIVMTLVGVIACCVGLLASIPFSLCMYCSYFDQIFGRLEPKPNKL